MIENWRPRGCGSSGVAQTRSESRSPAEIGRRWTIRLTMWTRPIAGNGKLESVISARWSGNASMCGYVAGSLSSPPPGPNSHTRR